MKHIYHNKKHMNKLILLRHGQSQWNLENRFTGWKNVPLTEKGIQEAKNAGLLIKKASLLPCPTDPDLRDTCLKTRKRSKVIYFASIGIFVFASFFTYVLPIYL